MRNLSASSSIMQLMCSESDLKDGALPIGQRQSSFFECNVRERKRVFILICIALTCSVTIPLIYSSDAAHLMSFTTFHDGILSANNKQQSWDTRKLADQWLKLHQPKLNTDHHTKYVILNAKHRSGSTFSAEFLRLNRNIFYMFEPLHLYERSTWLLETRDKLQEVLNCDLKHLKPLKSASNWLRFVFCHPTVIYGSVCKPKVNLTQAEVICKQSSIVAIKTIRMEHLRDVEALLRDGVKIMQLFRDPRGMMHSQQRTNLLELHDMSNTVCANWLSDLHYISSVMQTQDAASIIPNILIFRYEDNANHPFDAMNTIYTFLGLDPDKYVIEWVQEMEARNMANSTRRHIKHENRMKTERNKPSDVPYHWRNEMLWDEVMIIQNTCGSLMRKLGYKILNSPEEMKDLNQTVLLPFSFENLFL